MSIAAALSWIESTGLSTAIREGGLPYPILGGVHLLGIALFGGMVLIKDLRLLGWIMREQPVSELLAPLRTWKRAGFFLIAASGLLLAWAEPLRLYRSPPFWLKIGLLMLVALHARLFRKSVYEQPQRLDRDLTSRARLAAGLSLLLWAGVIVAGRLIGFDT